MPNSLELAELIKTRLIGVRPEDQDLVLDDADWTAIVSALVALCEIETAGLRGYLTPKLVADIVIEAQGQLPESDTVSAYVAAIRQRDLAELKRADTERMYEAEVNRLHSLLAECRSAAPQPMMYPNAEWCEAYAAWHAKYGPAAELRGGTCETCQGNGEIVEDWDRYLNPLPGDLGDEAVAECPACDGKATR